MEWGAVSLKEPMCNSGPGRQALLALVGITAGARKCCSLKRYLAAHSEYDVFVPELPYRKPLHDVSVWLQDYLDKHLEPGRYVKVHCIAYIAGALLLRILPPQRAVALDRLVCFRGPYQELVSARLVARVGSFFAGLTAGRSALDLADGWPQKLPVRRHAKHEGLVVELGRSTMVRLLGIREADLPDGAWNAEGLLPTADEVLFVPESHDDVYTSPPVLNAVLGFFAGGSSPVFGR